MGSPDGGRVRAVERVEDAREADERVLEHLVRLGCDPDAPHGIRHFLYLPDREAAEAVATTLAEDGWQASLGPCEDGAWVVVGARTRVLTAPLVRRTRKLLEALAAAHGGAYDGWEADAR